MCSMMFPRGPMLLCFCRETAGPPPHRGSKRKVQNWKLELQTGQQVGTASTVRFWRGASPAPTQCVTATYRTSTRKLHSAPQNQSEEIFSDRHRYDKTHSFRTCTKLRYNARTMSPQRGDASKVGEPSLYAHVYIWDDWKTGTEKVQPSVVHECEK